MSQIRKYDHRIRVSERNRKAVLSEILLRGPLPRTVIAERIGITEASVSRITRALINAELVEETGSETTQTRPGRKRVGVRVRSDGGFVAGIAINAFSQDIVISNISNDTIAEKRIHFQNLRDAESVVRKCAEELNQLIKNSELDHSKIYGCGVAVTGAVDPEGYRLRHSPVIGWKDVPIGQILDETLELPLIVESIPNAKNLAAHYFGPARIVDNAVLFNCSLAVGASLLVDGVLLRGAESNVGLIDGMMIPDEDTGGLIPLDLIAGGFGVIGESMSQSATMGDQMAKKLIDIIEADSRNLNGENKAMTRAGRSLAYAIMIVNSLLHPQLIMLSGPMINSNCFREAISERLAELINPEFVTKKIRFFPISSHKAVQSLAIHHLLTAGGFSWLTPHTRKKIA